MADNELDIIIDAKAGELYRDHYSGKKTSLAELVPWSTGWSPTANIFLVERDSNGGLRPLSIPTDTTFKIGRPGALQDNQGYATFTFTESATIALDELTAERLQDELNGLAAMATAGYCDVTGSGGDFRLVFRTVGDKAAITAAVDSIPTVSATLDVIEAGTASKREKVSIRLVEDTCAITSSWSAISGSAVTVTVQQTGSASLREVELVELSGFPSGGSFTFSHTTATGSPVSVFATAAEFQALLTGISVEKIGEFRWRLTWDTVGVISAGTATSTGIEEFTGITGTFALTSTQLYSVLNGTTKQLVAELADDGGEIYYRENIQFAPSVGDVGPGIASSSAGTFLQLSGGTMTGPILFSGTDHEGIRLISLTTAEIAALTPAEGMVVYDEDLAQVQGYMGAAWVNLGGSAGGGAFSDAGDPVVLNTTTKDVVVGASQVGAAKLTVFGDGATTSTTLAVKTVSAQTGPAISVRNSSDVVNASIPPEGTPLWIGSGASATGGSSMAIGDAADASGLHGIAFGNGALANVSSGGCAVGDTAKATGLFSQAFGGFADASATRAVAVGRAAIASATDAVQLGGGTNSTATTIQFRAGGAITEAQWGTIPDIAANTTHLTNDGSDHTFIDQDVTSGSAPTLVGTNFSGTAASLTVGATTGVEAGADVTDATNVDAAGAVMESDITHLRVRSDLTGLAGGLSTDMDSIVTATGDYSTVGTTVMLFIGGAQIWKLQAGTDAEDEAGGIVRPDDYATTTNEKVWFRQL